MAGFRKRLTSFIHPTQLVLSTMCCILVSTICGCSSSSNEDTPSLLRKLESQGKYAEMIVLCNEKLKTSPSDPALYANKGLAEAEVGKLEAAQSDLLKAIELDPNTGWYHCKLGKVYLDSLKNKEALKSLTNAKSMMRDPSDLAGVLSQIAVAHLRLDDPAKAIFNATEALRIDPKQKYTYVTRAEAYLDGFQVDKALADVNKSLELDKKNPSARITRAKIYFQLSDWQKAMADCQVALSVDNKLWQATEMLSAINLARGNVDEALELADQLVKNYPNAAIGYADQANCLFLKGDFEKAQKCADKAIELEPNSNRAVQIRLLIAARLGDWSRVSQLIEQLKTTDVGKLRVARTRALASIFLRDFQQAIEIINDLVKHGDKAPNDYRIRSEAYRQLHKNDLADADMKKALAEGYSKMSIMEQYLKVQK